MNRVNIWQLIMLAGAFALGAILGLPSIGYQLLRLLSFGTIPLWVVALALVALPILFRKV